MPACVECWVSSAVGRWCGRNSALVGKLPDRGSFDQFGSEMDRVTIIVTGDSLIVNNWPSATVCSPIGSKLGRALVSRTVNVIVCEVLKRVRRPFVAAVGDSECNRVIADIGGSRRPGKGRFPINGRSGHGCVVGQSSRVESQRILIGVDRLAIQASRIGREPARRRTPTAESVVRSGWSLAG